MTEITITKPFTKPFLNQLILTPSLLPFTDEEILKLDSDLSQYEQLFLDPDIEKNLISKNELLASFSISKAENSSLTLREAQDVYAFILKNEEYSFIAEKLKTKKKLTKKDYEKLEFFNIAKTFRNFQAVKINDITPQFIQDLHQQLTQGLDVFQNYLPHFDIYKSGSWRDNDTIRVGSYQPASYTTIPAGVTELLNWIKEHQTITSVGIFHTALYALHPFCNGNKRVSRILEHILLRSLNINTKNLYSTSYYYHKEKTRYYKYLLFSLERKNLNHFVNFFQESLVLSILAVIKTSLEVKRVDFLESKDLDVQAKLVCRPLIKRHEVQFKNLLKSVGNKMARQTFVNYLQLAVDQGVAIRRESGKTTFYSLNISPQEESIFKEMLAFIQTKLSFIPDEIKLA
jgi:Fic family protein